MYLPSPPGNLSRHDSKDRMAASGASRHGGGGGSSTSSGKGLLTGDLTEASSSSRHGGERDPLSSSRHNGGVGGKGGIDQLGTSRHGDKMGGGGGGAGVGVGAVKNWGLLRNTVRAISGSTAQKEHGGVDTLGASRHGGERDPLSSSRHNGRDPLSSSRHGTSHTHDENEATIAMAALFPVKSATGGPVKSTDPSKDGGKDASSVLSSHPPLLTKSLSKKIPSFGSIPSGENEATAAISALARQPSSLTMTMQAQSLGRKKSSSFMGDSPDFAEGDERASPAGKTPKTTPGGSGSGSDAATPSPITPISPIGSTDLNGVQGKGNDASLLGENPSEDGEDEQMKNERLEKKINDLLRKK